MTPQPRFPRAELPQATVPIWCVTPDAGTDFDPAATPFSPSGRYLALRRAPDPTAVVLVDLAAGTSRDIAWPSAGTLLWGREDTVLYVNRDDPATGEPAAVALDPLNPDAAPQRLAAPVAAVTLDGERRIDRHLRVVEAGLGKVVHRAAENAALADTVPARQVAFSPNGERLLVVPREPVTQGLWTVRVDGREPHRLVPGELWSRGGRAPSWSPDGVTVLACLTWPDDAPRFVRVRYDGAGLRTLRPGLRASGHPSLHPRGRFLLTEAQPGELPDLAQATLRLIDLAYGREERLLTLPAGLAPTTPQPAWDRDYRYIAFTAGLDGTPRVYVADLQARLT